LEPLIENGKEYQNEEQCNKYKSVFLGIGDTDIVNRRRCGAKSQPLSELEEIEIFEFIKKTGEKENEVKSALEIIQWLT
jgi:hypothetical protein